MKSGRLSLVFAMIAVSLGMLSCEEEQCAQIFTSRVQGTFYVRDTLSNEVLSTVPVFTLYGVGKENDKLYDQSLEVDIFTMPLSPDYNERSFVLVNDSIHDTLTFTYTSSLQLINTVCGFVPHYKISKVENTSNFIEAVRITDDDVNTDDKENIRVYLR